LDPYILTKIKGVGFKRADEIGLSLGLDLKSHFRIESCISYTLKEYCESNGNSSISKAKLFELLINALKFEKTDENNELLEKYNFRPPAYVLSDFDRESEMMIDALIDYDVVSEEADAETQKLLPASEYKGETVTFPDGKKYFSDGMRWLKKS
jgi:hypothetical protein